MCFGLGLPWHSGNNFLKSLGSRILAGRCNLRVVIASGVGCTWCWVVVCFACCCCSCACVCTACASCGCWSCFTFGCAVCVPCCCCCAGAGVCSACPFWHISHACILTPTCAQQVLVLDSDVNSWLSTALSCGSSKVAAGLEGRVWVVWSLVRCMASCGGHSSDEGPGSACSETGWWHALSAKCEDTSFPLHSWPASSFLVRCVSLRAETGRGDPEIRDPGATQGSFWGKKFMSLHKFFQPVDWLNIGRRYQIAWATPGALDAYLNADSTGFGCHVFAQRYVKWQLSLNNCDTLFVNSRSFFFSTSRQSAKLSRYCIFFESYTVLGHDILVLLNLIFPNWSCMMWVAGYLMCVGRALKSDRSFLGFRGQADKLLRGRGCASVWAPACGCRGRQVEGTGSSSLTQLHRCVFQSSCRDWSGSSVGPLLVAGGSLVCCYWVLGFGGVC